MTQSFMQQLTTVVLVVLATLLTRFLPFWVFPANKPIPAFVQYLGKVLPPAVFGLLVVYSLKDVQGLVPSSGAPAALALAVTIGLHVWRRNMLLSIAGGTLVHMVLVQTLFAA